MGTGCGIVDVVFGVGFSDYNTTLVQSGLWLPYPHTDPGPRIGFEMSQKNQRCSKITRNKIRLTKNNEKIYDILSLLQ